MFCSSREPQTLRQSLARAKIRAALNDSTVLLLRLGVGCLDDLTASVGHLDSVCHITPSFPPSFYRNRATKAGRLITDLCIRKSTENSVLFLYCGIVCASNAAASCLACCSIACASGCPCICICICACIAICFSSSICRSMYAFV